MGAWADVIKVIRSTVFKNELKNGNYSVKHATKADELGNLGNTTDNVARHVWFSDSEKSGLPRKDDAFKYNPITKTLGVKNLSLGAPEVTTTPTLAKSGYYLISAKYASPEYLGTIEDSVSSGLIYWEEKTYATINPNDKYQIGVYMTGKVSISRIDEDGGITEITNDCEVRIKQIDIA